MDEREQNRTERTEHESWDKKSFVYQKNKYAYNTSNTPVRL